MILSLSNFPDGAYAVVRFHPDEDVSELQVMEDVLEVTGQSLLVFRLRDYRTWTRFERECGHMRYVADMWVVQGGVPTCQSKLAEQWVRVVH